MVKSWCIVILGYNLSKLANILQYSNPTTNRIVQFHLLLLDLKKFDFDFIKSRLGKFIDGDSVSIIGDCTLLSIFEFKIEIEIYFFGAFGNICFLKSSILDLNVLLDNLAILCIST